ncbi:MAG: MerR family transcriptional regulator [Actinomycetota bacterium]
MGSRTLKKGYLSIGAVVDSLIKEYPDLSISKVRYLEDEGLLNPKRSKGGYRRFTEADIETLGLILRLQKEQYLPLKVIRDKVRELAKGRLSPADLLTGKDEKTEVTHDLTDKGKTMTMEEASEAAGLSAREINELMQYGLVETQEGEKGKAFDAGNVRVMHLVRSMSRHGVEPRHLKMYENFAEREASFLTQIIAPTLQQRSEDARDRAVETLEDLAALAKELRETLLTNKLRDAID